MRLFRKVESQLLSVEKKITEQENFHLKTIIIIVYFI